SLSVLAPPSITQQPVSLTVTQGMTASFTVTATGDPVLGYQWFLGASAVPQATNASLNLNNVQASQAGSYKVVVSNGAGSATSQVASLTVLVPPSITQQPVSLTVTQGVTASFTVTATGDPVLGYLWILGASAVPQATNASLNLNNVQASQAGNYKVVVSNGVGSVTSQVASLTVLVPPSITLQPVTLTVTQGVTASFTITATGDPVLGYQWFFDIRRVSSRDSEMVKLNNVQAKQ